MSAFINLTGVILLILMLPLIYRVLVGPTAVDRIVATNMIGTKTTVVLLFIGSIYERLEMFVDFALTYALLNFIGSLTISWYFQRKRAQENPGEAVSASIEEVQS